ncbi:MAG: helix-turn-helix transcriptional regulator [Sneathiellales bacterium]|nr:helix-turn-helix transcriptional regulator [Sneathiellales bacterium]
MRTKLPEGDFSSGMLIQVVLSSFERQGILDHLPMDPALKKIGPHIGLGFKRQLLDAAFNEFGLVPILKAGRDITHMRESPLGYTLLKANTPHDMLDRFSRLETYFHSRHRVDHHREMENCYAFHHRSTENEQPQCYESMLIAGLLSGLLELLGCENLSLEFNEHQFIKEGVLQEHMGLIDACSSFKMSWQAFKHRSAPVFDGKEKFLNSLTASGHGPYSRKVGSMAASDPVRHWSLKEVAEEMGLSARSLQRRLQEEKTSFSQCVMSARCQCAVFYITEGIANLSAVGFLSGFADAPHFSREFRKNMGMLPSDFQASLN